MMNVAGYVRVSTEEQAVHGLSIDAQKRSIELWAENNSDVKLVGIYADEGVSARKQASKRKGLCRLLEDVKTGKIDTIVFTKLDRWTRNVREYHKCQEILEAHNVTWRALQEDYETQTASGRFVVNVMLGIAEQEADRTSERIKAVNEMKRAKAIPLTGQVPFGYKIVDNKVVKDENAPFVEKFFEVFKNTGSIYAAMENCGTEIKYGRANKILKLTAYYGDYWGIKDMCPAYITKDEYDKIQSMRKNFVRKTKDKQVYLFSGICTCAICGHRMTGSGRPSTSNVMHHYYLCQNHTNNRVCPNNRTLSESKIVRFLMENLDDEMRKMSAVVVEDNSEEIVKLNEKKERIKELFINGMITMEQVKKECSAIDNLLNDLQKSSTDYSDMLNSDWKEMYQVLTDCQRQAFWRKMLKEIRIDGVGNVTFSLN